MSSIEQVIARSRSQGTLLGRRHFTLARGRALDKMREFALRTSEHFVLELIQAAVLAGAEEIAVDVGREATIVAFVGGAVLSIEELTDIYDYLFADQGDRSTRHLQQLAVALNGVLQLRPTRLRIESGDGTPDTTAHVSVNRRGTGVIGISPDPLAGTYVLVDKRMSDRAIRRITNMIEERCLYTPVPIHLNGTAPFGYRPSRKLAVFGVSRARWLDDGGRRALVAARASRASPRGLRLVVGGVWVTTARLTHLGGHEVSGVVCDDGLRKTADQADIVRDDRFRAMVAAVRPLLADVIGKGRGESDEGRIEQLGLRPSILPGDLAQLAGVRGLFAVDPVDEPALARRDDPLRLPRPVLVLGVRSAEEILDSLGGDVVWLRSHADLEYAGQAAHRVAAVDVEPVEWAGGVVRVSRYASAEDCPRWGVGGVPVAVRRGGRGVWCGVLRGLVLPRIAAVVDVTGLDVPDGLPAGTLDAVLRGAARLADREGPDGSGLRVAVLAEAVDPRPVCHEGVLALAVGLSDDFEGYRGWRLVSRGEGDWWRLDDLGSDGPVALEPLLARIRRAERRLDELRARMAEGEQVEVEERLPPWADPTARWLVRCPVVEVDMGGYVGLAMPFQPWGVLRRVAGRRVAWPAPSSIPCQGLVSVSADVPTDALQGWLVSAVRGVYAALLERVGELDEEERVCAVAYARAAASDPVHAEVGRRLEVALGVGVTALVRVVQGPVALDLASTVRSLLRSAITAQLGPIDVTVRLAAGPLRPAVWLDPSRFGTLCVALHRHRAPVAEALAGKADGVDRVVLAMVPLAVQWAKKVGHELDPLRLQRSLLGAILVGRL